ncbi:predicted transcriptional regulator [Firmicutes bacterium CAG:536]|nr:predicted transcriptional regulator [Firmicutes bacterium CAG:536]
MNRTSLCIRMLLILKANATKQNPINSKELAQALEVNPRNIREYKRELITAGYNIQEIKGRYGGYYLDETSIFPALRLDKQEEQALLEAKHFIQTQQFEKKSNFNSAVNKVLNSSRDMNLIFPIYMDDPNIQMSKKELSMLHTVQDALEMNHSIELTYQAKRQQASETYLVDPYELIHYHDAYYVLGYNHTRQDYRMYRFSSERMKKVVCSEKRFTRDVDFHVEAHIGKNSLIKGEFYRVTVWVSPAILRLFKEAYWGLDFREEEENIYSFLVEDLYLLYRQLFSFGKDIRILSPEQIVNEYQERLVSTLRNYQG